MGNETFYGDCLMVFIRIIIISDAGRGDNRLINFYKSMSNVWHTKSIMVSKGTVVSSGFTDQIEN